MRFGYDGDGVRLWKREYLPRPLGVVVRLTLYVGYGFEEGYVEEVVPHEAGDVCGKVEGVTDLGFTGQRQEIGFGLYDYKARYFSPALGRFISPDSIVPDYTNPQALNRYAYVYGNPLKYTDPTGHCPLCIVAVVGAVSYFFFSNEMPVGEEAPPHTPVQNYVDAVVDLTPAGDAEDAMQVIHDPTLTNGGIFLMSIAMPEYAEQGAKKILKLGYTDNLRRYVGKIQGVSFLPEESWVSLISRENYSSDWQYQVVDAIKNSEQINFIIDQIDLDALDPAHKNTYWEMNKIFELGLENKIELWDGGEMLDLEAKRMWLSLWQSSHEAREYINTYVVE